MPAKRAYLAGPEVFLPDAARVGEAKKAVCARHGLEGVFPLDAVPDLESLSPAQQARAIYLTCRKLMDHCDLLIANMTPFRGPSADVGTAFEMGYMRGRGRPVFGYSNSHETYAERILAQMGDLELRQMGGALVVGDGLSIENFELSDNLMLPGVVHESGTKVVTANVPQRVLWTNLAAFEVCVKQAVARFKRAR